MSVAELLRDLAAADIHLWEEQGRLRYSAPPGAMTPERAARIRDARAALLALLASPSRAPLARRGDKPAVLSFAQERLWSADHREGPSGLYNEGRAMLIGGELNIEALRAALGALMQRHEILRSCYPARMGIAQARIDAEVLPELKVVDLSRSATSISSRLQSAVSLLSLENQRPFDLTTAPLMRCLLVRISADQHAFGLFVHHIVCDGLSLAIACGEIVELYEAFRSGRPLKLPDVPLQYFDFAVWQREHAPASQASTDLAYWREALAGVSKLALSNFQRQSAGLSGNVFRFPIAAQLMRRLDSLARTQHTTPFTVLLAGFGMLLAQRSGALDIVMTSPVTERRTEDLSRIIGLFVNSLILRSRLDPHRSVAQRILDTHRELTAALAHQETPFERVVAELAAHDGDRQSLTGALAQLRFVYLDDTPQTVRFEGLSVSPLSVSRRFAKFDLMLTIEREAEHCMAELEYRTALFEPAWIEDFAEALVLVLTRVADQPESSVGAVMESVASAWSAKQALRRQERGARRQRELGQLRRSVG